MASGQEQAAAERPQGLAPLGAAGAGAGGRASCGHRVSAAELQPWVRALLQQGITSWRCPRCPDARWLWQELRDLGLFSGRDQAWLEATILAQEGARSSYRQCPRCQLLVQRPAPGPLRTACPPCSRKAKQLRCFCWGCHQVWEETSALGDTSHGSLCALLTVLHDAPEIQAPESSVHGCPSLRACPECRALVTHNGLGCPMVRCPQCQAWFCYRCLDVAGHWRVCMVAARQQDFSRRAAYPPPSDQPVLPTHWIQPRLHVPRQQAPVPNSSCALQ
ncbi:uncharacterized protein LOC132245489 isoform X3 [Alligator mississippiensis]|uniref:uncharacterized protein LOC132245489 isoform X3 n=1 Tax=Alligator mississippiensis TaxID=8496 RepID=UPI002877467F|nr:uncharacterized protein LOC132245489 isoform X3 [Alligator mississippiensis]